MPREGIEIWFLSVACRYLKLIIAFLYSRTYFVVLNKCKIQKLIRQKLVEKSDMEYKRLEKSGLYSKIFFGEKWFVNHVKYNKQSEDCCWNFLDPSKLKGNSRILTKLGGSFGNDEIELIPDTIISIVFIIRRFME